MYKLLSPYSNFLIQVSQHRNRERNKANLLLNTMEPSYDWLPQHSKSFSVLEGSLSKSVLHHISLDTILSLITDASETTFGAALHEISNSDKNRPLAFFSRRLTQAERNHSTNNCLQFILQPLNFVIS